MSNLVLNAGILSMLGDWFYNLWINLWLLIDNIIYVCINWMYRVFILVSKVDIFGGGDQIEKIVERLYLIVGIAMLFIFAYNLILLIINPEGNQLGNMGKVIQNALISIILVTLLPLIFSYMSTIQSHIIDSNVIGHIILGTSNDPDADPDNKKAGVDTALTIFSAFYHPKDETLYSCKKGGTASMCSKYISVYDSAYNNNDITSFIWDKDLKDGLMKGEMEYTYILSSVAGVFALWMFVSFGLDIGIRVGKLAFYQLISPIPVMMRILPGDKMFGKWFSGLKDTYMSLFIRLAVIYFCMYAITFVDDVLSGMWATSGDNVIILALANVLVILGILKFAQEAPKLIGDLFGKGGSLDFSIGKKYRDAAKPLGRVADTARAGIYGATTADSGFGNRFRGFFGGAGRGARYGYAQGTQRLDQSRNDREEGSTLGGRMQDRLRNMVGMRSRHAQDDADVARQTREFDEQLNDIARQRDEMHIDEREANNSEVLGYRSNITDIIAREAAKSSSKFEYKPSTSSSSYIDENGNKKDLSGMTYSEIQSLYNSAQANGLSSAELDKIQNYMDTGFYTDSNGNMVKVDSKNISDAQRALLPQISPNILAPKSNGAEYTVAELEQAMQKAQAAGAGQDDIDKIVNAINATKAIDEVSYVDKNGTRHEISGNLSQLEKMYESAYANGESEEVLTKIEKAKNDAKKSIEKQILSSIMDGNADTMGVSTDAIKDVEMNIKFINDMVEQGRVAQDSSGNATITVEMQTADDILKGLKDIVGDQKRQIQIETNDLNRKKQEIERQKKELERQKNSETYRSRRADDDAVNRNNSNRNS